MKSVRYLWAILVLFGTIGVTTTIADTPLSVVVVNNTSYTLVSFFASSSDSSGWTGSDLMNGKTVGPGQQATIQIGSSQGNECSYDLMGILDGASQYAYQYGVNACDGGTWAINP